MSDMQDQAAQDSLLKTAASESDSQASSAAQSLSHNSADQSMQPLLRSPCRTLLSNLRGERPNPQQHYKVGIYIRCFNQTKHVDYLDYHVKQYQDTMALCPNWELIDFYIDEGATAPNMESAPEWCRLLQDCFRGKVNLIITQKVSNVSKKDYEITFLARILASLAKPVGIYFVSEDIFMMASCYQDIRNLVQGIRICEKPPEQYVDMLRELSAIGNNVNQIAHWANSKGYASQAEIHEAAVRVNEAYMMVRDAFR